MCKLRPLTRCLSFGHKSFHSRVLLKIARPQVQSSDDARGSPVSPSLAPNSEEILETDLARTVHLTRDLYCGRR